MARVKAITDWTQAEDEKVVQIVLQYVREGNTLTAAFLAAHEFIDRTEPAIRFRWNTILSKQYSEKIKEAKHQREILRKKKQNKQSPKKKANLHDLKDMMDSTLEQLKENKLAKTSQIEEKIPVTTGVQEEFIMDIPKEKFPVFESPFEQITRFVQQIEQEMKDTEQDVAYQLTQALKRSEKFEQRFNEACEELHTMKAMNLDLSSQVSELNKKLEAAQQEIQSFDEIKALIVQFNAIGQKGE